MPAIREVLAQLQADGWQPPAGGGEATAPLLAADEDAGAPWFVHLFIGLGTWIGAMIAATFLFAADLLEYPPAALTIGVLLLGGALALARSPSRAALATQLTWVLAIGGELAVLAAVGQALENDQFEMLSLTAAALQLLVIAAIPNRLFRLASTVALIGALTAVCRAFELDEGVLALLSFVTAAALTVLWRHEARFACAPPGAQLWRPLAFGLAFGLPIPLITQFVVDSPEAAAGWPALAVGLGLALLAAWAIHVALAELGRPVFSPLGLGLLAGLVLVAVLARSTPGLIAGLLLLILAQLRQEPLLHGLGLLYVGGFLFAFYYQLAVPLLEKSLWVTATGLVLLVLAVLLRRLSGERRETAATADGKRRHGPLLALVLATAVALAIPAGLIRHQEQVLANGRTVLLQLRPRDPRSLMQGDYMTLRYDLDRNLNLKTIPRRGKLVLHLDEQGVATLVEVWDGSRPLATGEQLLRYRVRPRRETEGDLLLGAESFFFEEGTAGSYNAAAYGELKVTPSGGSVLVGLRDAELQRLGVKN